MLFIDYRNIKDNEIKEINNKKEILYKDIKIYHKINYENLFNELNNILYYDFYLTENEIKEKILFNIKLMIFDNINNINDILKQIVIKKDKKEILFYLDKNTNIKLYKFNNEKIFNECIKFLNKDNEKLNEYIEIIKKYDKYSNKEIELKEKIKKYEIELKEMKNENYKIKNELRKKFNYELYYY